MSNGNNSFLLPHAATPQPGSPDHFQGLEPRVLMAGTPTPADSAMAYDAKGNLHFAYYDAAAHNLKYTVQSAGNGAWSAPVVVDKSSKDVGQQVSLALDKNNRPAIAYRDTQNQDLKYARFDGKKWVVTTVDAKKNTGINPSLAFDKQNHALISFFRPAFKDLQLATQGADLTTWTFTTLATNAGAGHNSSVAVDPKSGKIAVAFKGSDGKVRFVDKAAGATSFNKPVVVDKIAGASDLSLTFGPGKKPAFTYYDPQTGEIKLATKSGKAFDVDTVATVDPGADPGAKVIINPSTGKPQVVFYDSTNDGMFVANKDGDLILVAQGGSAGTPVAVDKKSGKVVFTKINDNGKPKVQDTRVIPVAPSDVDATAVSTSQIDLSWSDNSDNETAFKVLRSTNDGQTWTTAATLPANTTAFSDTGLTEGTTYVYKVAAVGPTGVATLSTDSDGDTTLPAGPSSLTAVATSPTSVSLLWSDNSRGETSFTVERSDDDGENWTALAVLDADATSYTDTTAAEGLPYVYRVTASNDSGDSTSVIATVTTTVAAPTGVDAASPSASSVSLSWTNHSAHSTGVIVERSSDGVFFSVVGTLPADATAFVDSTVDPGALYTYRVKATGAAGHSPAALSATTRVRPGAPAVTATAVATTRVNLSWPAMNGAASYVVERSTDGGDTWTPIGTPSDNSFADDTAAEASSYDYRVRAVNAGGQGANSNAAHATTFLAAPSDLAAAATSTALVHVTWTDNSGGETGFILERTDDNGTSWHQVANLTPNTTSFDDDTVTEGAPYGYRIHAFKSVVDSDTTSTVEVITPLAAPEGLTATAASLSQVDLAWTGNSATHTGFEIYRSTNGGTSFALLHTAAANESAYSDTSVTEGATYVYKVRAVNTATASAYTADQSATVLPDAPTGLTGTVVSPTRVDLSWTDNSAHETGYRVEISADSGATWTPVDLPADATTYSHTGATEGTHYKYRVFAVNDAGDSVESNHYNAVTLATAASGLTAAATSATNVHLTWTDNSANELGFIVERSDDDGETFTAVSSLLDADTVSFDDLTAAAGTGYVYRVLAANAASATTASNTATALTLPAAPGSVSAVASADLHATLSWTAVTGATGYTVERSADNGATWDAPVTLGDVLTYADTSATEATDYLYRVSAVNATGAGATTDSNTVTTLPAAASDLTATVVSTTQVDLAWTDHSGGETGYLVERSSDAGANFTPLTVLGANAVSYSDLAATEGTSYVYRISPVNGTGTGADITADAVTAPDAPDTLAAIPVSATQIDLTWNANSTHDTGYVIERSDDAGAHWTPVHTTAAGASSWSDTTVVGGHSYQYRLHATGVSSTVSADSNTDTALTVPAAVSDLTLSVVSDTQINVTWTDTTGETGYTLERSDDDGANWTTVDNPAADSTSFNDTTVLEGVTYTYRLTSANTTGPSAASNTPGAATLPAAPDTLAATPVDATHVSLTWADHSAHETAFVVERSDDNGATWTTVQTTAPNATSWTDTTVTGGNSYQYRVTAKQDNILSTVSNTDTVLTHPAATSSVTATVVSDTTVDLAWDAVTGADSYLVEYTDDNGVSWQSAGTPTTSALTFSTATESTAYTFRVFAVNATGNSASTSSSAVTTLAAAPTNVLATANSDTEVDVTWDDNSSGETGYRIERSDDGGTTWTPVHTANPGETAWADMTLTPGTTHAYRVFTVSATGDSAVSNTSSALTFPDIPANVTATPVSATRIDLAWDAVPTATGYEITFSTDGGGAWSAPIVLGSVISYSHTGLSEATPYSYRVAAVNASGTGTPCAQVDSLTYPAAATSVTATPVSAAQVDLAWSDNSSGETGYRIERSDDGGATWTPVHTANPDDTSWSDTTVTAGHSYSYRVFTVNLTGDSLVSNVDTLLTHPGQVTGLTADVASDTQVDLSWTAVSTATGYKVEASDDNGVSWSTLTASTALTTYSHTGATEATPYLYRVTAINATGNGAASATQSATTYAALPTTVTVTPVDATHVTVSWDDNSAGETHYVIERSDDNGGHWSIVNVTAPSAVSWSDTTVTGGNTYLYRVTVQDAAGDSPAVDAAAAVLTVPGSVAGFTAEPLSTTAIDLSWTAAHGATGYVIEVFNGLTWDNVATINDPATVLYHVTSLTEAAAYDFRISAINTTGSGATDSLAATTFAEGATGLTATPTSNVNVDLTWVDNSMGEDGFYIERSSDGGETWSLIHTSPADAVSYSDDNAAGGSFFTYRVTAFNAAGDAARSNHASALTVPDGVGGVDASATSDTTVTITWTPVSGVDLYTVRRSTDGGSTWSTAGTSATASFDDTGLTESNTYTYDVIASNATGDGADSDDDAALTRPAAPTALAAVGSSTTAIDLTWADNSSGETGYKIERSAANGDTWTLVHTTAADATSWSDTVTESQAFLYRVFAYNADGPSALSSEVTGTALPAAPSVAIATATGTTTVTVDWTDNSSAEDGFVIQRSNDGGVSWSLAGTVLADVHTFNDTSAPEGTAVQYRVRAFRNASDSAWSNTATDDTLPAAPSTLTATASDATTVDLAWADNSAGETGYDVYRSDDNGTSWTKIHTTAASATSWSDAAAPEDTALMYKVVAAGAGGDSADSNTASTTTPVAAPTSLTASAASDTTVDLAWTDNSSVETGYKVYRSTDGGSTWALIHTTAAGAASYSDTSCTEDTPYTYKVVATDGAVDSADSNTSSATTALTAPAITGVSSPTSTSVTLTWSDNSLAEDGYKIERSDDNGSTWAVVHTTLAGVTTWTDSGLTEATQYKYQIRAYHGGNFSAYTDVSTATTIPATPNSVSASPFSTTQIDLTWADNSANESAYVVERSSDGGATWTDIHTTAASATSYSDTTAHEGTDYVYRVRATGAGGDSAESDTSSATTAPDAPTFLTVTMVSANAIMISWADNSVGETAYEIERSTDNGSTFSLLATLFSPDQTTHTDDTVAESTAYVYRVRALRNSADSAWSNSTTQVTTLPAAASNLAVTTPTSTRAVLTWTDNSAGETGFKVMRSTDNGDTWSLLTTTLPGATTYSDNTVTEGHSYLYQVFAFNTTGDALPSDTASADMVPASPTSLSGSAANPNRIDISWTDRSSAETGYKVERSTNGGSTWTEVALLAADSNSWSDTTVIEATNYQYRVRAYNDAGNSGYTNSVSITTPLKAPTSLVATTVSATAISLSWTDNSSGETQYKVERSSDGGSTFVVIATLTPNSTSYNDTGLTEGHAYQYKVRAAKTGNTSAYSNTVTPTTLPAAPTSLTATPASSTQVNIAWTDNSSGETGFVVERSSDAGATWTQIATPAANATSYNDTTASEGTAYLYRVKALSAGGSSAFVTSTTATTLPGAPTVLVAASPFGDTVNLTWTDNSTHETGFKIERSDDSGVSWTQIATVSSDVTAYADATVDEATTYQYRVRANINATNSSYSNTATVTTVALAPDNLVATPVSQTQVDLTWTNNSAGHPTFNIERSEDGGLSWTPVHTTAADEVSWSDTTASEGLYYQYRVQAHNAGGDSAYSSTAEALTLPAAASNLAIFSADPTEIVITWTDNSVGEESFFVERQTDAGTWDLLDTLGPDSNSYSDSTVTTGHTYAYRVRASNASGDAPNSNTDSATV